MEWTELNIYTTTEGIDLICSRLMDIGVKGFAIKDAEDFNEFLENKNGKVVVNVSECPVFIVEK